MPKSCPSHPRKTQSRPARRQNTSQNFSPRDITQKELIALSWAMILGKDKKLNIYADSKYAFLVLIPFIQSGVKRAC